MTTGKKITVKGKSLKAKKKRKNKAGDRYICDVCGLGVTVDEECCCADPCDLICCDMPMQRRRSGK
jgi:hypothetical protein